MVPGFQRVLVIGVLPLSAVEKRPSAALRYTAAYEKYASFLMASRALHLSIFEQPAKNYFFKNLLMGCSLFIDSVVGTFHFVEGGAACGGRVKTAAFRIDGYRGVGLRDWSVDVWVRRRIAIRIGFNHRCCVAFYGGIAHAVPCAQAA